MSQELVAQQNGN